MDSRLVIEATKLQSGFRKKGFLVVPDVVSRENCETIVSELPICKAAGSRSLLQLPFVRLLVSQIRDHSLISCLIGQSVAIQCIYFQKTKSANWGVRLHRDSAFPVNGDGHWKKAGVKEGMSFVRPPIEIVRSLIAVRLCLDEVSEGDLNIVPKSHVDDVDENRIRIDVPRGGVLIMSPHLLHSSAKLRRANTRRVLHFVFGPRALPEPYSWYYTI